MPIEASDTLRSIAKARIIDLLAEGEIGGLVNGGRSVYLDETPLQNADGTFNFKNVVWAIRTGTNSQGSMPGFNSVENTVSVGVEVKQGTPVVRAFSNTNLSAVMVVVSVPSLTSTNSTTGDVSGTSVRIAIDVQPTGGTYETVLTDTISGKTTSLYERSYRVKLTGRAPWNVRVRRLTADSASTYLQNKTFWKTAGEIIDANLRYPNSAVVGISFDAEQFGNIPNRAYDLRLLKIKVPSNYDPLTKTYTGSWDGTFQTAWSDNPAWVFYDLLTNSRYGLGGYVPAAQVDKWALYTIGRYCDELVPDGFGGMEPRFTCNVLMNSRTEAYKVINDLATVFRGLVYWSSGSITAVQDSPATASYLYTPANVVDGSFTYSGSSAKARHTVALVTWNDPADFFRQKVEYVEDREGITRYGVIETQVAAIGCTSRGQAARVGRWLLYSERLETEVVTFRTGLDGTIARPGQIIKVADPARAGVRFGGRIVSATTTTAVLDSSVTLVAGQTYTFSALKSEGTVMESTVSTGAGTTLSLSFAALPEAPVAGSIWILASGAVEAQTFRVVGVVETEKNQFEITALAADPTKFDAVELGLTLQPRSISVLTPIPASPGGVNVTETLYVQAGTFLSRLDVSWEAVAGATSYVVAYQRGDGNLSPELYTRSTGLEIDALQEGAYTLSLWSVNAIGDRSKVPTQVQKVVQGKTAPPSNVTGFVATRIGQTLSFIWRPVSDIDIDYYEIRQGTVWATGVVIGTTAGQTFSVLSPRGGTYMIKAVDTSGNYSTSEAVVVAADLSGINVVVTASEADGTGFSGAKVGAIDYIKRVVGSWDETTGWDSTDTWDAIVYKPGVTVAGGRTWSTMTGTWSTYTDPWLWGDTPVTGPYSTWASMTSAWTTYTSAWKYATPISGTYTSKTVDIGYVAASIVSLTPTVDLLARASRPWSWFTGSWSTYAAPAWTWQGLVEAIGASFEISTSEDNVTWSTWVPFSVGTYRFRYLRIRVTLTTTDADYRPFLNGLRMLIDVPDRVVHLGGVSIPIAGATLSFSPQFVGIQTVQATLQSAASGDRFVISGKSTTGVTVNIYDSAGSPKAGTVDIDAFGYGERY